MEQYMAEYYEQPSLWEGDFCEDPHERARITAAINAIPSDVRTVVDLGCGNGAFLNSLLSRCPSRFERVVGLDSSREALRHVKAEVTQGSVAELPFEDGSFDLVTCMEVLEHLPQSEFWRAVDEMQRVSLKYVLLTVPNGEQLARQLVMCPECMCCFNPYFHVRSFDEVRLRGLLATCRPIKIAEIGPRSRERGYNNLVYGWRLFTGRRRPPAISVCPQCGFRQVDVRLPTIAGIRSLTLLNHLLHAVKLLIDVVTPMQESSRWLLALYERQAPPIA
jgi:SAM-dependent methyltransferase